MPYVGSSIITTSIVVTLFLLFLSYGYKKGGNFKGDYLKRININLLKTSILIGTGLSTYFIGLTFEITNQYFNDFNIYLFLTFYILLFISPSVFFLGQIIPLTVHLNSNHLNAGEKTGHSISLSTFGNVFGGLLTTLIIMHYLGSNWAVIINCFFLLFISFIIYFNIKNTIKILFLTLIILVNNNFGNLPNEGISTEYSDYYVIKKNETKYLLLNNSIASIIKDNGHNADYIEFIKNKYFQKDNLDILVLGAGGFSISQNINNQNFTYVDIDNKIKEYIENNFINEKIKDNFIAQDARLFVQENKLKYDIIFIDLYSNQNNIPEHLKSIEFYKSTLKSLKENGLVLLNVIHNKDFNYYDKSINKTLNLSYETCFNYEIDNKNENNSLINYIYACYPNEKIRIKTDFYNDFD